MLNTFWISHQVLNSGHFQDDERALLLLAASLQEALCSVPALLFLSPSRSQLPKRQGPA